MKTEQTTDTAKPTERHEELKEHYLKVARHTYNSMRSYGEYTDMKDFLADQIDVSKEFLYLVQGPWDRILASLQEVAGYYLINAPEQRVHKQEVNGQMVRLVELLAGLTAHSQWITEQAHYFERMEAEWREDE